MPGTESTITHPAAPRCVAIVGPQASGKTSLLESILSVSGGLGRKGLIKDGNTLGDASDEARSRQMSTEVNLANVTFLDDPWTLMDCPGSVELESECRGILMAADAAVVVCEPDMDRVMGLGPLLRFLDDNSIPHMLFVNKLDAYNVSTAELLQRLQSVSQRPLVLREVPIREGESITGYVDLVSERAYRYDPGKPSQLIKIPDSVADREQQARQEMLEHLADFDDDLMERLLEDVIPPAEEIYQQLARDLAQDLIVPVMFGAAERDGGVRRLLKLMRHEVPVPADTAARLEVADGTPALQVFRTIHAPHTGKMSLARVWRGKVSDGMTVGEGRVSGLFKLHGGNVTKVAAAEAGEVVALGKLDALQTGDMVIGSEVQPNALWPEPPSPVFALAINPANRGDEVKLTGAIQRLLEEDTALRFEHGGETSEMVLHGQGGIHLQLAVDRLKRKYNVEVNTRQPQIPYKETIRGATSQHSRFKRQTGGHGQFADVKVEIRALGRGEGFVFEDKIVGGAIPRNYIPAVELGIRDFSERGPLGFPVVDFAVTLVDGQFHAVDSSDMAFKTAGRMAVQEGLPKCGPVLLEPIDEVTIAVPSEYTPKAQRILSSRRGQILGFDARPGWEGWDEVKAYLPRSECHDLIVDLRSLTLGLGTFSTKFDHLQELTGREADKVVEFRKSELESA